MMNIQLKNIQKLYDVERNEKSRKQSVNPPYSSILCSYGTSTLTLLCNSKRLVIKKQETQDRLQEHEKRDAVTAVIIVAVITIYQ